MMYGRNDILEIILNGFLPRPASSFPRYRNIFSQDEEFEKRTGNKADIFVYTRMGGGNRDCWGEDYNVNEEDAHIQDNRPCQCPACESYRIERHENCVGRYDDDFDCTYTTFGFKVPDDLREDFDKLKSNLGEEEDREEIKLSDKAWKVFKSSIIDYLENINANVLEENRLSDQDLKSCIQEKLQGFKEAFKIQNH